MIGSCCDIVILYSYRNVYDLSPLRLQPIWHLFQWFLLCVRCRFIFLDLWQVSEVSPVTPCDGSAISWEKSSHLIESQVPPLVNFRKYISGPNHACKGNRVKISAWKSTRGQGIFCAGYIFFLNPTVIVAECLGEDFTFEWDFVTTCHAEWQPVTAS